MISKKSRARDNNTLNKLTNAVDIDGNRLLSNSDIQYLFDNVPDSAQLARYAALTEEVLVHSVQILQSNGNPARTLRVTTRDGKVVWLEEGVAIGKDGVDFGMLHIWDKHHPNGAGLAGVGGSQFPSNYTKDDISNVIFEVIEAGETLPLNPNHPGKYVIQKEIDFGSGVSEIVKVALDDSGNILSAFPLKDID